VAYKHKTIQERNQLFENIATDALQDQPTDTATILGIDVVNPHSPYNVLARIVKRKEQVTERDESRDRTASKEKSERNEV
jgi:hypothetical protein